MPAQSESRVQTATWPTRRGPRPELETREPLIGDPTAGQLEALLSRACRREQAPPGLRARLIDHIRADARTSTTAPEHEAATRSRALTHPRRDQARDALLVGLLATAVMDAGGELIRRVTGVPPLDYTLVGRWLGHMTRGRFVHDSIGGAEPFPGERPIGLIAHYSIGTAFAGLLLALSPRWSARPTLGSAMTVGLASTAAPFFLMQPAFGLGIAASRTSRPTIARFRSLRTHAIYGLGLYLAGHVVRRGQGPAVHTEGVGR